MSRGAFYGFEKLPPDVREAPAEFDAFLLRGCVVRAGERGVCAVAVALDDAAPASRNQTLQAVSGAARVPGKDCVAAGFRADPEVALFGFAVAGGEVFDHRFVHLHVAAAGLVAAFEHLLVDGVVHMHEVVRYEAHPLRERLARDVNIVPRGEDFLLPMEREMVANFSDNHRCNEPGCGDTALLHRIEPRDDRRCKRVIFTHIFFADDVAFEKFRWLIIEQLGAFFADEQPLAGAGFYRLPLLRLRS